MVTGRVLEGDGVTPVATQGNAVSFASSVGVFARQQKTTSNASGNFTFTGGIGHPIPLADFTLTSTHPTAQFLTSPAAAGLFADGQTAAAQNIVFSDTGVLTGIVRRHTGLPVVGASVVLDGTTPRTTDGNGRFSFGGVSPGTRFLSGTLQHGQGSSLSIVSKSITIAKGQAVDDVLLVEPTGTITGTVRDSNENIQPTRPVTLTKGNFQRYVNATDTGGRFTFTDVPLGTFTVSSPDPASGFVVSQQVTIAAADQTQDVTLHYLGNGTLTVNVTRADGGALNLAALNNINARLEVSVAGSGVSTQTKTITNGQAVGPQLFNNLPIGQTYTVTALLRRSDFGAIVQRVGTFTLPSTSASTTLALPAFGQVSALVAKPGAPAFTTDPTETINVALLNASGQQLMSGAVSAGNPSFNFEGLAAGSAFTVRTTRTKTVNFSQVYSYTYITSASAVAADGQTLVVNTHYPAVATLDVTLQDGNGVGISNSKIEVVDVTSTVPQARGFTGATGKVVPPYTLARQMLVPEGTVGVRAFQPGNTSQVLELAVTQVTPADDGGTVAVTLVPKAFNVVVTGVITEADGVTGVGGVFLRLRRLVSNQFGEPDLQSLCTKSPGNQFCNGGNVTAGAPVGAFQFPSVVSTGGGLVLQASSPADNKTYSTTIVPTADGTFTANLALPAYTVTLTGHIYAADGSTPVPGGSVVLARKDTTGGGYTYTVAPDGSYLSNPTLYPIEGMRIEYGLPGVSGGAFKKDTIAFTSSGQVVTTDLVLADGVVTRVKGTVVAGDGVTPIRGAYVDLITSTGTCCSFPTAQNGTFDYLAVLPSDGQFTLRAHSPRTNSIVAQVTGANAVQGATKDVGAITLPISLVTGLVTNGPSAPVDSLTVFVRDSANVVRFADSTPGAGTFEFYELPAGDYQLTVQNYDAATESTVPLSLPTATTVVSGLHIELPIVGHVDVHVLDADGQTTGQATVAIVNANGGFERTNSSPDFFSHYVFDNVALGNYTAQASLETCDENGDNCVTTVGSAQFSVVDEGTVNVTVSLALPAHATLLLRDFDGTPLASSEVTIALQGLNAGPLGTFTQELTTLTDANGMVPLTNLPVGSFVVRASAITEFDCGQATPCQSPRSGSATATATTAAGDQPIDITLNFNDVAMGPSSYNSVRNVDVGERFWSFNGLATLADTGYFFLDGNTYRGVEYSAFYGALGLQVQSEAVCCPLAGQYLNDTDDELTFSPVGVGTVPGLVEQRRLRVIKGTTVARVLDTFTNTTSAAQSFQVTLQTNLSKSTTVVGDDVSPSSTTGGYLVRRDSSTQSDPYNLGSSFGVVFAGIDAPTKPAILYGNFGTMFATNATIVLAPGESKSLLSFVVADRPANTAAVSAEVEALASLTEPEALVGLTRPDILKIVNFRIPPPPPGPSRVRVTVADMGGNLTTAAALALFGNGVEFRKNEYEATNNRYEFTAVPPGTYTLQARLNTCADYVCDNFFTEMPLTVPPDQTVSTQVSFADMGRARVVVADGNGPPFQNFDHVVVDVRSFAAIGPLGQFTRSFDAQLDGTGALNFNFLPPGRFEIAVQNDDGKNGAGGAVATKGSPALVELRLGYNVGRLTGGAFGFGDAAGYQYVIDDAGRVAQLYLSGGGGAFEYAAEPREGSALVCCAVAVEFQDNEIAYRPAPLPVTTDVVMTRRMRTPPGGGYIRLFDVYTNTSSQPRTVQVSDWTKPQNSSVVFGSDVAPSSTTGGYFVRDGSAESFAVVYAGVNPPVAPTLVNEAGILKTTASLTLAPGESLALLHFVLARPQQAPSEAQAAAEALSTLSDPDMLAGLTRPDLALIANFRITLPPAGPATMKVRVVRPNGSVADDATVALVGEGYSQTRAPYDVNGDSLYEFSNLAPGEYVAQASFVDYDRGGITLMTQATVNAVADTTTLVPLSFAGMGRAHVVLRGFSGEPLPFEAFEAHVQSLSAAGPLGTFTADIYTTTDEDGTFEIENLPPGTFMLGVRVYSSGGGGVVTATAVNHQTTAVLVQLNDHVFGIGASLDLSGADHFFYRTNQSGAVDTTFFFDASDSNNLVFRQTAPFVFAAETHTSPQGARICCSVAGTETNGDIALTPMPLTEAPGVLLTRRLFAPAAGGFMRYFDSFTNTASVPRTVDVSNWTQLALSDDIPWDVAPSTTTGGYFVGQSAGDAFAFAVVYAGVNPPTFTERLLSDDQQVYQPKTTIVLAPGQTISLLHYLVLRAEDQVGEAMVQAEALATLTEPNALAGLSPADLTSIANFRIP
ncbi:MAG: carboxypeptidase-like regulatory domain-containing protein [Vicinamibacterales bacterium]